MNNILGSYYYVRPDHKNIRPAPRYVRDSGYSIRGFRDFKRLRYYCVVNLIFLTFRISEESEARSGKRERDRDNNGTLVGLTAAERLPARKFRTRRRRNRG